MSPMRKLVITCGILSCFVLCRTVAATDNRDSVAVRGDTRPSFQITPLVQRLSGRQGQRVKFRFDVKAFEHPQSLRIRPVGLRQALNGLIVVDEAPPAYPVNLSAPEQMDLKAAEKATIRGQVDLPLSQAPFHVFGILVTDLGRPFQTGAADTTAPGVHVRFVTQYLLRVEVRVENARPENAKALRVESASLVEQDGNPFVEAYLANPTENVVEVQVFCRILNSDGLEKVPAFGLTLPVRAQLESHERFDAKILGRSRVRLVAPVPAAVFSGDYQLELEWLSRNRKCGKEVFPVTVEQDDFPAQASMQVQIGEVLRVEPSQIELSVLPRGNRRLPLRVANEGPEPLVVQLTPHNLDGTVADWVLLQPSEFIVPAGRGRNVLVTARADSRSANRYGHLRVAVHSENAARAMQDLPLGLLVSTAAEFSLSTGSLSWDTDGNRPGFVLRLQNNGPVHLPLNGRLVFRDVTGQRVEVTAGYGRWLLPGQEGEIRFPLHRPLSAGVYPITVALEAGEGTEPVQITEEVKVP